VLLLLWLHNTVVIWLKYSQIPDGNSSLYILYKYTGDCKIGRVPNTGDLLPRWPAVSCSCAQIFNDFVLCAEILKFEGGVRN
jgi:hypothetical protein